MAGTNDFLPVATGAGANVLTQAEYAALTSYFTNGYTNGAIVPAQQLNKATRQASLIASIIGELVAKVTGQNVVDDGTTGAILSNFMAALMRAGYVADTGAVNAYVLTLAPAILSYYDGLRVAFSTVNANTTTAPTVNVNGLGPVAVTLPGGAAIDIGDIKANAVVELCYNSTGPRFELQYGMVGRSRLKSNLTLYVATTGNDSNTGLTAGSPFLTLNKAYVVARDNYDTNGFNITIQLADGTYTTGLSAAGRHVGGGSIIIQGNTVTPTNVTLNPSGGKCIEGTDGAQITAQYMQLLGAYGLASGRGAVVKGGLGLIFGTATGAHLFSTIGFGTILMASNYTIAGSAPSHWLAAETGHISAASLTITLTGTPAFSAAFATAVAANISCAANTFSGSATGVRHNVQGNGVVSTNGTTVNTYLPGNANGTTSTGGQYL